MSSKKKKSIKYVEPELNIMPFIDVFGLLTTYLLFSAVFVSIGILEVQVPFISNAAPPSKPEQTRVIDVKVDLEKDKVQVVTSWSMAPRDEQTFDFTTTKDGLVSLHKKLVEIRVAHADIDLLTLFTEDDVTYEMLTNVLDAVKIRWEGDPLIPVKPGKDPASVDQSSIFPKVVLGSVML